VAKLITRLIVSYAHAITRSSARALVRGLGM